MMHMGAKKTHQEFVSELKEINLAIEVLGEYSGSSEKVECRCRTCGHLWNPRPTNILRGKRCPRCAKSGTSFMEQFVYHAFVEVLGKDKVISRDRKAIGMELDVYVPEGFAVELGSWNWHKDKVYGADAEKRMRCKEQGIRLVTIYDSVPWSAVVPDECKTYPFDLASEEGHVTLTSLTLELISLMLGGCSFVEPDWQTVEKNAAKRSGVRSHEQFVATLQGISPTIRIESRYYNGRTKVACRCDVCERRWEATPDSLLRGHGCPSCGTKRMADAQRKPHAVYVDEVERTNPSVAVIGEYIGDSTKVACQCKKCGHKWEPWPSSLRKGHGCPKCGLMSSIRTRRKTQQQFISDLADINPSIEVLGRYVNATTKIECRCKECSYEWNVVPDSLLQGTGCPRCGKKKNHDSLRKTHEQFILELKRVNSTVEVLGKYTSAKAKVNCWCTACEKEWMTAPDRLLRGMGCPTCGRKKAASSRRKTHEQFVADLKRVHPTIEAVGKYEGKAIEIPFRCEVCGHAWVTSPDNLLHRKGCPKCSRRNASVKIAETKREQAESRRKTYEQFVIELAKINPDVVVVEAMDPGAKVNAAAKIRCLCKTCEHVWTVKAGTLLRGSICPRCVRRKAGKSRRKTHEQFVIDLERANPKIEALGKYEGKKTKIPCRCKTCGHAWDTTPDSLLQGNGCPACKTRNFAKRMADKRKAATKP